jgi:formylglycine-generating enzyme required for sulfatase activity
VVHVAYEDALAYARWLGRSLPTEAQWEYAARGGREGEDDWSSAFDPDGKPIANTWQGTFPFINTAEDGYSGTAPVGCFKANFCARYRPAARQPQEVDLSVVHIGFRTVLNSSHK